MNKTSCRNDYMPNDSHQPADCDDKFISAIVSRNICQLLKEKYPIYDFQVINGLYFNENGRSRSHAILGPGFNISVRDVVLSVSQPTRMANLSNESFEFVADVSNDSVDFDLANPDSIDQLLTYISELMTNKLSE